MALGKAMNLSPAASNPGILKGPEGSDPICSNDAGVELIKV